ncbi:hypothetical protein DFH09DRAFT_1089612 [Mycena vulgaris]|nr:hypothetical protein DFH09DRAFT_1089612 [Mycena vulgaris]
MTDLLSQYKTCAIAVPDSDKNSSISKETIIGAIGGSASSAAHAVVTKLDQLWDSGATVTYSYSGGTVNQQDKVDKVILEWFPYANITFQRSNAGTLRIAFDPKLGSWSYVGKVNLGISTGQVTMNLGWVEDNTTVSENDRGVILHEFGHALGLLHEHQSPARAGTLHLDENAVYAYYAATQGWDKATIKSQIIDVYNASDVSNFSALDMTSIMMYFMPSAMNLERVNVAPNNALSDMDKAYMIINYPRPTPHSSAPMWTLDYALKVSGVDAATTQDIKNAKGDVTKIRAVFTAFQVAARAKTLPPPNGVNPSRPNGTAPANGVNGSDVNGSTGTPTNGAPNGTSTEAPTNGAANGVTPTSTDATLTPSDTWCAVINPPDNSNVPNDALHGVVTERMLWLPYEVITYGFMDASDPLSVATTYRKDRVNAALALYMRHTSIRFKLEDIRGLDFSQLSAQKQCQVRISFGPTNTMENGSIRWGWSHVGKDAIGSAFDSALDPTGRPGAKWTTTYLGGQPLNSDTEVTAAHLAMANTTVYHELGHVLGLRHEHDSPQSAIAGGGGIADALAATMFDPSSVMLYPNLPYKANSAIKSTLNQRPSNTDLGLLRLLYPDNGLPGGMFAKALDAFAFNATDKKRLLDRVVDAVGTGVHVVPSLVEMQDAPGTGGAIAAPLKQAPGFLLELVNSLKQFFNPGGNQIFTLQFPGRFLDQGSYAWDTSLAGIYGQFIKPTCSANVGGPNGTNLSIVYEQWIKDIMARQQTREQALADAVAVSIGTKSATPAAGPVTPSLVSALAPGVMFGVSSKPNGNGDTLNRIELSELLMNEYLYAKQDWEIERDALISGASQADIGSQESQKALNDLTRKLAHITTTRQAQLAAKYSDAVVRGYSHTVREYMGYLDIASPAEALQNAKDSLREAAMSSLDGSMKVYPVQMSPLDWFEGRSTDDASTGLSTSFTMEDLTQDPEVIRVQINAKSQQLDTLNAQLVGLQMGAKGDPTELKAKVEAAQTALDKAQSTLSEAYSNNVISMASTCLDTAGKVDLDTLAGKLDLAKAALAQLPAQMEAVKNAQDNLTSSSRALSQMRAAQALAEATDSRQQQQQLTLQIQTLTGDLKELQTRWQILTSTTGGVTSEQWSCNLWLASGSESSLSSSGASASSTAATEDTIDLAFRATLVTVDRGGWFQPQFFKESKAFYKVWLSYILSEYLVNIEQVNNDISWVDDKANKVNGLMPGFPVAFLIAKDIVVRVTHAATNTSDSKTTDASSSASSGGFLCFSYSKSNSSNSSATASSFQAYSNGYIIKIPGPQILGYMIQKTDSDDAELMPAELPADFFIPDDEYNKAVNGPANGANPAPEHSPAPVSPAITQDKMQEALAKMLNEKVAELFKSLSPSTPAAGPSTS